MTDLDELAQVRRQLGEFLRMQSKSILFFSRDDTQDEPGPAGIGAFYRTVEDRASRSVPSGSRLTTTITCLESLLEIPSWQLGKSSNTNPAEMLGRLEGFMGGHLENSDVGKIWKSDEAAWVYCRVRTLGSYLRLSSSVATPGFAHSDEVRSRVAEAWQSHYQGGASFGLREATSDVSDPEYKVIEQKETTDQQYPPNAYLTYWGLLALRGLGRLDSEHPESIASVDKQNDKAAQEWLTDNLARQVAYHYNNSSLADPQQLAWSICGLVRFADGASLDNARSPSHELLVAGLRAFFEQMRPNGDWPLGAPLFHYRNAGNAYSYIYEVLGELLSLASAGNDQVGTDASAALRRELRPHWQAIRTMLDRAIQLGQRVEEDPDVIVWSSGHHPHRSAESWATASVFRLLQSLRRIVGLWCSAETKAELDARKPRHGEEILIERGETWDTGSGNVGQYLRLAFLWPIQEKLNCVSPLAVDRLFCDDPDAPVLAGEEQARSAILFGPPGTGKTNLVEAIAGALGWEFIEITPARFIDQGVDLVSARADHIFRQLMQIDRCVVLLDEIDELIQLRGAETDPLERFFTTTMLPRLAKLWELGRVLFFVNTNDIERVDTAIRRAQRFDAALFVLPPSYRVKQSLLEDKGVSLTLTKEKVNAALEAARLESEGQQPDEVASPEPSVSPGWFALMRFDQVASFAATYKRALGHSERADSHAAETEALKRIANELTRLDWLAPPNQKSGSRGPSTGIGTRDAVGPTRLPSVLGRLLGSERRDDRRQLKWREKVVDGQSRPSYVPIPPATDNPESWARDNGYEVDADGLLVQSSAGPDDSAHLAGT